jgi:hypothetical protein
MESENNRTYNVGKRKQPTPRQDAKSVENEMDLKTTPSSGSL